MVSGQLYRKDMNDLPPSDYFHFGLFKSKDCYIRYSELNHQLLALDKERLLVFNLFTKKIVLNDKHGIKTKIADFRIYGEKEDCLMILTGTGKIYSLRYGGFKLIENKIIGEGKKKYLGYCLSISGDNRYVCLSLKDKSFPYSKQSMFMVLEISKKGLRKLATCQIERRNPNVFSDLCFLKQVKSFYFFVGFSRDMHTDIYIALYNSQEESLKELGQLRCRSGQAHPIRVQKVGSVIYMIGRSLKLNTFSISGL